MVKFIGCSGFHYEDWKKTFYPEDITKKEWLPYYADHFRTVEINTSFYSLPSEETLKNWHRQTPRHFKFAMKGSRYVTHQKKLVNDKNMREGVKKFYRRVEKLKGKLGCVLWQLPGNLHRNDKKLADFCSVLSTNFKNIVEFRHTSWFDEEVYKILKKNDVGFCILSAPDPLPETLTVTTKTAYIRFHGKNEWYDYNYYKKELKAWADKIKSIKAERVYCYFNNDAKAQAVKNAAFLKKELAD